MLLKSLKTDLFVFVEWLKKKENQEEALFLGVEW
jgi:hypothetical protein